METKDVILYVNSSQAFGLISKQLETVHVNLHIVCSVHGLKEAIVGIKNVAHCFLSSESSAKFLEMASLLENNYQIPTTVFNETDNALESKKVKDVNWKKKIIGKLDAKQIMKVIGVEENNDFRQKILTTPKSGDGYFIETEEIQKKLYELREGGKYFELKELELEGIERVIQKTVDEFGEVVYLQQAKIEEIKSLVLFQLIANARSYYMILSCEEAQAFGKDFTYPLNKFIKVEGANVFDKFNTEMIELDNCEIDISQLFEKKPTKKLQTYIKGKYIDFIIYEDNSGEIEPIETLNKGVKMFRVPSSSFDIKAKLNFDIFIFLEKNEKFVNYCNKAAALSSFQLTKVDENLLPCFYIKESDLFKWKDSCEKFFMDDMMKKITRIMMKV